MSVLHLHLHLHPAWPMLKQLAGHVTTLPSFPVMPAVLRGLWPTYSMQPGVYMNTSDTIDKVTFLQIQAGPSREVWHLQKHMHFQLTQMPRASWKSVH
jgi:hypothetical protein